jgi:uncharacterized protein involved in cysteine biosynthesis
VVGRSLLHMKEKLIEYFAGGSNHYPLINQWHTITEFIQTYITTNPDWIYFLQILIFSLCIIIVAFIILFPIILILDTIAYIVKTLINETKRKV